MLHRLILKVTKFQLPGPKRVSTVVKNMSTGLRYSHKTELLHSLLVSMATKVIYEYISPQRTFAPNMKLKYFHVVDVLQHPLVGMLTVVTMANR